MIQIPDNVSKYTNVYDVLEERGLIEQCTDPKAMRDLLGSEKIKFYVGFDPNCRLSACWTPDSDYYICVYAQIMAIHQWLSSGGWNCNDRRSFW